MNTDQLETGNKLLLLQAINSIEHGLQCIEWMSRTPNEIFVDALTILRDRFAFFKESAFVDDGHDYLMIDKVKDQIFNLQNPELEVKKNIDKQLSELRKKIVAENKNYK